MWNRSTALTELGSGSHHKKRDLRNIFHPSEKAREDLDLHFLRSGTWLGYIVLFHYIVRSDPFIVIIGLKKKKKVAKQTWPCLMQGSVES